MTAAQHDLGQRSFVKLFDSVCNWNQKWERWQDMVNLFAISIASATDRVHAKERLIHYEHIREKYSPYEFAKFNELFDLLVENLEANPRQDFLGKTYMELELGSHWHGQFFTPYNLCAMMAKIALDDKVLHRIDEKGWIAANDPACGGGATLIGLTDAMREKGINYQQRVLFVGQDLDSVAAMMCYVQLSLLGCAGYVHVGNTLTAPLTGNTLLPDGGSDTWYMPMYFCEPWASRVLFHMMVNGTNNNKLSDSKLEKPHQENKVVINNAKPRDKRERPKNLGRQSQISFFD